MKTITNDDDLIVEQWYWVRMKLSENATEKNPYPWKVLQVIEENHMGKAYKYIGIDPYNKMWCHKGNSQALKVYDIVGPIPQPLQVHIMKLIYIGDKFYEESKSIMSPVYTEHEERSDWGFMQVALRNGEDVNIRQATSEELAFYEAKLAKIKKEFM